MALRTRYAGSGLGLKPISIGSDPYSADSEFDSTVRIPSVSRPAAKIAPPSITAMPSAGIAAPATAPIAPQQPVPQPQPQVQQPIAPPTITQPPAGGLDPSQLNYQGSTFNPGISPTTTTSTVDQRAADQLMAELEEFSRYAFPKDWRQMSPEDLLAKAKEIVATGKQYGSGDGGVNPDTSFRTRLDDWYKKFEAAIGKSTSANPEYEIRYKQQEMFNSSLDRLKQAGAAGAREQDEELMAMLASRGLLDSGIAAREIGRLQEERNRNLYEAANRLNELLLSGDISRLTSRDLATLEADLQKRNQESLARLQQKFAEQNQPDPLTQILTTAAGVAAPFLLSPKAPERSKLYGEEDRGYRNA